MILENGYNFFKNRGNIMGLEVQYMRFINNAIHKVFGYDISNKKLKMLELGNQEISPNPVYPGRLGKEYYSNLGFDHTSVDLNGMDGALPLDLRIQPLFREFNNTIDVLTNSGTTEHVEPHECQYDCFNIIHDCVKVGGIMIHLLPDVVELDERGWWIGHCTNYYSTEFFEMLASECNYEILGNEVMVGIRAVALRKLQDNVFTKNKELFLSKIAQR